MIWRQEKVQFYSIAAFPQSGNLRWFSLRLKLNFALPQFPVCKVETKLVNIS